MMLQFLSTLSEKLHIENFNLFLINIILSAAILIIGIFLGKFSKFILKKLILKSEIDKTVKKSFVNLFLTVIEWTIYIGFVALALNQLGIPQFTKWLTGILVVIPALVGSLILICVGFAIAIYLKVIVEESKIAGWSILGNLLFYFVLYIFMIYAIKTALISQDKVTVNYLIIILTGVVSAGVAFWHVRGRK